MENFCVREYLLNEIEIEVFGSCFNEGVKVSKFESSHCRPQGEGVCAGGWWGVGFARGDVELVV